MPIEKFFLTAAKIKSKEPDQCILKSCLLPTLGTNILLVPTFPGLTETVEVQKPFQPRRHDREGECQVSVLKLHRLH